MKLRKTYWKEILVGLLLLAGAFVWFVVAHESRAGELKLALLDVGKGSAVFIDGPGGIQVLIDSSGSSRVPTELGKAMPFYDRSLDVLVGVDANVTSRYETLLTIDSRNFKSGERIILGSGAVLTIQLLSPFAGLLEYGKTSLPLTSTYPIEIGDKFYNPNFAGTVLATTDGTGAFTVNVEGSDKGDTLASDKVAELLTASALESIGERVKESGCHVTGPYPDHECTPGAIFPNAKVAEICVSGYTKKVRSVSVSLKRRVYTEYGLGYPQKTGTYEADHMIPLELGGNNDIAKSIPESGEPTPGFHEKDLVENYLHQEVCAGRADLGAAQKQIANDWLAVYLALTPEQIKVLKNQFRN